MLTPSSAVELDLILLCSRGLKSHAKRLACLPVEATLWDETTGARYAETVLEYP